MASSPITSWQIGGETVETVSDFIFLGSKITADGDCSHEIEICLLLESKVMTNMDRILKSRDHFANKGLYRLSNGFSSSHVWIWKLGHKEGWAPTNWYFWIVVLEKTLQTPLDSILNLDDMLSLDSILKSRDITLPTNVCLVKAMVFPVVMYRCETWTIKKIECWRTDALKLWCWKRLLRVPWTARRSNQLILNVINPEYSVELTETEALILWPRDAKSWLLGKDLDAGKDWRQEGKGQQKMRWLNGITGSMDMHLSKLREIQKVREAWHPVVHGVSKSGHDLVTK